MRTLLEDAAQRAISYLENLDARSVAPLPDAVANLALLDRPLPEEPSQSETVLKELDEVCSGATVGIAGRRYFGFVIGGALPTTLAASWLAGTWDQNTAYHSISPATAYLEQIALGWLLDLLHLPPDTGGGFVTGATVANFTALAAARHAVLERAGWNVEADGLFGAPSITVIVGAEAHPTLTKSLGLLGLGRNRTVKVATDSQGRISAAALPPISGPTIVCVQAGNVNTGAFDPIAEICERAHRQGAWVHVDGAFGLWALAAPSMSALTGGIADADSWATDFHKWLNVPYDSGIALVRDAGALRAAMAITAEYLPANSPFRAPSDFVPELSRRARGVEVWTALRALGRAGVAEMIERNCRQARRFAEGFKAAGYQILNDVVLNQVLVSFGDAAMTNRVIAEIQQDGTCWCGGTVWQAKTAMRISVCSWATTDEDVETSLAAMLRIAQRCKR
ncbi:MAG TPA: aminotransferase class V-fold PLP-dependent enzyme [Gammaproteobacteria bacterium]|nr:aminotransferase class V-fold PLP-dependent enzyme [Gammaproteobacteria bacterium]